MTGNAADGDECTEDDDLRTSTITDLGGLLDIKEAWHRLVADGARSSVFLTYEWIDAAWAWLQESRDLNVVCCHRSRGTERDLVSVAPFCLTNARRYRMAFRELSLIEVPDSQECDIAVDAEAGAAAVSATLDRLLRDGNWDVLRLPKLQPDSVISRYIAAECDRRGLRFSEQPSGDNFEVDIGDGWQSYYATRSRRLKKGNNNIRNRIHAQFEDVAIQWSRDRDNVDSELPDLLAEFKRISSISWKKDTGLTLDQSGPGRFIDRLTEHAVARNWLSLWALSFDGRVVATEYQLAHGGFVCALRADFDPDFSDLSPGSYLNWQLLQRLCDEDLYLYRMGQGSNAYKLRWSNRSTPLKEITVYNKTLAGRLQAAIETAVLPALRRARRVMRGLFASGKGEAAEKS